MDKKNDKFGRYYLKFFSWTIAIILSFFFMLLLYWGTFWIHEGGHIAYGKLSNWYEGRSSEFKITSWKTLPYLTFLEYPQQTRMIEGTPTLAFALGGPIFVILVIIFFVHTLYKITKRKIFWAFIALFIFHEIFGNFLCGTDNPNGNAYAVCQNILVQNWWVPFFIVFTLLVAILTQPLIEKIVTRLINYIPKKRQV